MVIYYCYEKAKGAMSFSKILAHSCMIIHYTVEENIFAIIFFLTKEILKCHMNGYFRINGKQRIKIPKRANMLDSILRGK